MVLQKMRAKKMHLPREAVEVIQRMRLFLRRRHKCKAIERARNMGAQARARMGQHLAVKKFVHAHLESPHPGDADNYKTN